MRRCAAPSDMARCRVRARLRGQWGWGWDEREGGAAPHPAMQLLEALHRLQPRLSVLPHGIRGLLSHQMLEGGRLARQPGVQRGDLLLLQACGNVMPSATAASGHFQAWLARPSGIDRQATAALDSSRWWFVAAARRLQSHLAHAGLKHAGRARAAIRRAPACDMTATFSSRRHGRPRQRCLGFPALGWSAGAGGGGGEGARRHGQQWTSCFGSSARLRKTSMVAMLSRSDPPAAGACTPDHGRPLLERTWGRGSGGNGDVGGRGGGGVGWKSWVTC